MPVRSIILHDEDDQEVDYLGSVRDAARLKDALIDEMDASYNRSRRADKKLLMDIDNRLDEPAVTPKPRRSLVHVAPSRGAQPVQYVGGAGLGNQSVQYVGGAGLGNQPVYVLQGGQLLPVVRQAPVLLLGSPPLSGGQQQLGAGPVLAPLQVSPVTLPTQLNTSTRGSKKANPNYRSQDTYESGNGTELSFRRRLLDNGPNDYSPTPSHQFDDMRSRLRAASVKLDQHRHLTADVIEQQEAKSRRSTPTRTTEHVYQEPPLSDARRRARAMLAKSRGSAY